MKLYAVKLCQRLDPVLFQSLFLCVDKKKRDRINRFFNWQDAHRVLLADCLARCVVIEETGLLNKDIRFTTNKFRKPELDGRPEFYFNLSHSGNWVVCAVDQMPVGVDIEKVKDFDPGIFNLCLTREEQDLLWRKKISDRRSFFFTLWTLKESYLKALGCGLQIQPNACSVLFRSKGETRITNNKKVDFDVFLKSYDIDNDHKMAVSAFHDQFPLSVIRKEHESILQGLHIETSREQ